MAKRTLALLCATGMLAQLAACSGGGGGSSRSPSPSPPPANAAPTFGTLAFSGTEDTDLAAQAAATDPEGAAVTITSTSQPAHGTLVSLSASGEFLYRPAANYFGSDSFDVRAQDPAGNLRNGTVTITIAPVNDAPQVAGLSISTDEETSATGSVVATDADNNTLTFTAILLPANGILQNLGANGSFTYVPNRGYAGTDVFQLRVSDGAGATATATVNVTVRRTSPVYTGATDAVTISESTAARSARSAWLALKIVSVIADSGADRIMPAGPVDLLVDGSAGTLRVTGTLTGAGIGTLTGTFTGFRQDGVTLDGQALFEILDARTATSARVRILPRSLRYRDAHLDATLSGYLLREDTTPGPLPTSHVTGELLAIEGAGVQHRFASVSFDAAREIAESWSAGFNAIRVRAWSGSARAYDSRYGYVDVSASPSFRFPEPEDNRGDARSDVSRPYPDGSLVAAGAGSLRVWLTPLSPEAFSLEVNRAGSGPDVSVAYRWEDDFAASAGSDTGRPLLAVATTSTLREYGNNGTVFKPEGRFSEQAAGRFLRHQWRLVYAPPGSNSQLTGANTARPSFIPDVSGDYVLNLVVSEGTSRSSDYLLIESVPPQETAQYRGQRWPFSRAAPGGAPHLELGQEFVIDGRRTYLDYYHLSDGNGLPQLWSIWENTMQQEILVDAPGRVLRFTPPRVGMYAATQYVPGGRYAPMGSVVFSVGPGPRSALRVRSKLGFRQVDWDGDGDIDSVGQCSIGGIQYLGVMYRNAAGRYGAPQCMTNAPIYFFPNSWNTQFEDLSGDGRLDVILLEGQDVSVALQQPNGSLSSRVQLADPPCNGPRSAQYNFFAVDVDRNGRSDVVRTACDGNVSALVYNPSNPDGTFGPARVIPTSPDQVSTWGISADIDGDGDREILGYGVANGPYQSFTILSVNSGGTFDSTHVPVSTSFYPDQTAFRVADLNGDGRRDLIGGGSPLFLLTQNANGTFTERSRFDFTAGPFGSTPALVGDITGDGRVDVLYLSTILEQQPGGTFAILEGFPTPAAELVDVDLDGRVDFIQEGIIDINAAPE